MKFAYKTELKPTEIQAQKIKENIGTCRWLYNQYISLNYQLYQLFQRGFLDEKQPHFLTAKDFDKYINNKIKVKNEYKWLDNCGSKARKKAIVNAELAFKRHFDQKAKMPKFKRRDAQDMALYFPKNNPTDWIIERHRIKIPTFGWVRLKEYGYLPTDEKVINGNVSYQAGRFYISLTVDKEQAEKHNSVLNAVKIEFEFITVSENESLNFRLECLKNLLHYKRKVHGTNSVNQEKIKLRMQKLKQRLACKRKDYFNKQIAEIIAQNPQEIFLPKLKSKDIEKEQQRNIYIFRNMLLLKCNRLGIRLSSLNNSVNQDVKTIKVKIN